MQLSLSKATVDVVIEGGTTSHLPCTVKITKTQGTFSCHQWMQLSLWMAAADVVIEGGSTSHPPHIEKTTTQGTSSCHRWVQL